MEHTAGASEILASANKSPYEILGRKNKKNDSSVIKNLHDAAESADLIDRIKMNEYRIINQMNEINSLERILADKQDDGPPVFKNQHGVNVDQFSDE